MEPVDLLGRREVAILDAVHRGAMRSRACAGQVRALVDEPASEALLHDTLRRFEELVYCAVAASPLGGSIP
jgi:hypothetical protein